MTGQSTAPASRRRRILPRTFESDEALLAAYRAALDRVPTLTRVVFLLHRIDDLAFDDIARRLSIEVVGGRLREGAESYAKDLGQRYSPVRLMCSHPNGETWASRSGAIWVPLAARVLTTSPSFMVFQNMMMAASRFIPAMR